MKSQLHTRLAELKSEFEAGQNQLKDLAKKRRDLESVLLRISGAIQVIEELLDEAAQSEPAPLARLANPGGSLMEAN